jgi:hypothetical protein
LGVSRIAFLFFRKLTHRKSNDFGFGAQKFFGVFGLIITLWIFMELKIMKKITAPLSQWPRSQLRER